MRDTIQKKQNMLMHKKYYKGCREIIFNENKEGQRSKNTSGSIGHVNKLINNRGRDIYRSLSQNNHGQGFQ